MKIKRSTLIPAALLVYLAIMCIPGYKRYAAGTMGATEFFGIIGVTLAVIVMLHFTIKRRERLRAEREADMKRNEENNQQLK